MVNTVERPEIYLASNDAQCNADKVEFYENIHWYDLSQKYESFTLKIVENTK